MKGKIQSLVAKVKSRKLRILHWLALLGLLALLGYNLYSTFGNKATHVIEAGKNKQLIVFDLETEEIIDPAVITIKPENSPAKTAAMPAVPVVPVKKTEILIIVSGLGLNNTSTEKALALPPQVLLSFSPYAEASFELSKRAKERGHSILVDLPLQMKDPAENPGNLVLRVENSDFKNQNNLNAVISKAYQPSGVLTPPNELFSLSNNFLPILSQLSASRLFLVYGGESENIDIKAKDTDVGLLKVDIIMDEAKEPESIAKQITNAEGLSSKSGFAVMLVRSPSPALIDQISAWTKTFEGKNINLVSSLQ